MEHSTSSDFLSNNRLISYLQTLAVTKKGLPHGLPVCAAVSHTITTTDGLLQLASAVGPHIAILKVFADIIDDWSDETVQQLTALAKKHSFIIWEGGRVLNSTVNVVGKQTTESREVKNEIMDIIRKKYTKGVIRPASWAVMATAWASGVDVNNQEGDILIPTLKAAARETVAGTVQTIRTEITADSPSYANPSIEDSKLEIPTSPTQHLTSDYVAQENGLGLPLRKASTISLTQTITQHTENSNEPSPEPETHHWQDSFDGEGRKLSIAPTESLPEPPLLSRGLVLCLPSVTDASFTPGYRRSSLAAARANQDFVLGFLCSEPWHIISQRNDIFDIEPEYEQKTRTGERIEDNTHSLVIFSLVSHRMNSMNGKHLDEYTEQDGTEPSGPSTPVAPSWSTGSMHPMAEKLHSIMEQALKFRYASAGNKESVPSKRSSNGTSIQHIPIVSLP